MINIIEKENCVACGACLNTCPVSSIKMQSDDEGFLYPAVDISSCINCHQCEKVCPVSNFHVKECDDNYQKTYAAVNKDSSILLNSSSGGVFQRLASWVINSGGIVVGAGFTSVYGVCHIIIDKLEDIELLQSSKYAQSCITTILGKVKETLIEGKYVLYSGTPCQIAGLRKFLKKDYENLITVDIVCHGVPSPGVWKRYLDQVSGKKIIEHINFRSKKNKNSYGFEVTFKGGEAYFQSVLENPYMKGFINNLYLRPSCYCCKFKGKNRFGDITLGDLWRADKILSDTNNEDYISLVVVNSGKGNKLFELIRDDLYVKHCSYDKAIKYNKSIIKASAYNPKRKVFFKQFQLNNEEIIKLINFYTRERGIKPILRTIKSIVKNLFDTRMEEGVSK